ncbi:hypothetical protein PRIPAC_78025 [Pristionchus pacificus]|uniref:SHSP domain-containing protein n=1 Tax=Pristionchus pacificus TaxID=54126 RepID=A0A2A6CK21_PRIPA|nr:hypothetical protein PRIPAC_78025 [Pristionchus pacificus]|eukprot:PDM78575.1 hypothetical protein PRIPAC_31154 [Pristionchus pacificus]
MSSIPIDDSLWDWPLQSTDGIVKVHNDHDKFEVDLDAQYFTPQEIQVKVIGRILDIHFEHQTKKDSLAGDVSRSLPEDVDLGSVKSALSPRGTLTITAAKKPSK